MGQGRAMGRCMHAIPLLHDGRMQPVCWRMNGGWGAGTEQERPGGDREGAAVTSRTGGSAETKMQLRGWSLLGGEGDAMGGDCVAGGEARGCNSWEAGGVARG